MSSYLDELTKAMTWLGEQPDTFFLGQSVSCEGTPMRATFKGVDPSQLLEFPVAENLQLGVAVGLSLEGGTVPVAIFPRWNFLLLAADQLINHLDRIPLYSPYRPKVIIRTAVGRSTPLDPGPQHQDDFSRAFEQMLRTVVIVRSKGIRNWCDWYRMAYEQGQSVIIVEDGNLY